MKKETLKQAYMMVDMMKTVLTSGTGTNMTISGVYQAGKTGTLQRRTWTLKLWQAWKQAVTGEPMAGGSYKLFVDGGLICSGRCG